VSKNYAFSFLLLESILLFVFSCVDILWFYIFFEAVLLPMYFIIGIYGSRDRRIKASYYLFLYTLLSSILMFLAILFLYFKVGSTNIQILTHANVLTVLEERLC